MPIRPYTDADEPAVLAIWDQVFHYTEPHNDGRTAIALKQKHGDGLFFVATLRKQVVGTVMLGWDGHRGWIYSLAVDPNFRRRGIGTALMKHAEKTLRGLGALKINLQVVEANRGVVKFYEDLGWQVEARINMGKRL